MTMTLKNLTSSPDLSGLAQDAPKRPGISRVKRTEWGCLSEEDLRRRYADGPESEAYDRFKQAGLILDLRPLLRAS